MMNYLTAYEKFILETPPAAASVKQLREEAFRYYHAHGLPTRKQEDWKYTSLKSLSENNYTLPKRKSSIQADVAKAIRAQLTPDMINLVFFNSEYRAELSADLKPFLGLKAKVVPASLNAAQSAQGDLSLQALSGMFSETEIEIEIEKNVSLAKPLRILFFTHLQGGPSLMMHPRVRLKVGVGSKVSLIESHQSLENSRYFVNSITSIEAADNACLSFIFHQKQSEVSTHVAQTIFSLGASAKVQSLSFQTGSQVARHQVDLKLSKENAEADLLGLSILAGTQHIDNKTLIRHDVGHCTTRQLYKSILDGESRAVFSGKIKIALNAQKASSEQLNKNLLLSSKAEVDSEPQLEVEADDVKATHGSTVGQLSEEEVFYFKSRGISQEKALSLLSYGFAADIVERIENTAVSLWLKSELQSSFAKLGDTKPKVKNLGSL